MTLISRPILVVLAMQAVAALSAIALLAGCATPGGLPAPLPLLAAPAAGLPLDTNTAFPTAQWWQALGDPGLDGGGGDVRNTHVAEVRQEVLVQVGPVPGPGGDLQVPARPPGLLHVGAERDPSGLPVVPAAVLDLALGALPSS